MPNFFIVGAPKSGSSSVCNYLNQHPDVFIPSIKEPRFYISESINKIPKEDPTYKYMHDSSCLTKDSYFGLYDGKEEILKGDGSVQYLYHYKEVIPKIKNDSPNAKIVIILRNPLERAYSNYRYQIRGQFISFDDALEKEDERYEKQFNSFWYYKRVSLYYNQVKAYIENFEDVKVMFYEDLRTNKLAFMEELNEFLGLTHFNYNLDEIANRTVIPKNSIIARAFYYKNKYSLNFTPKWLVKILKKLFFKTESSKLDLELKKKYNSMFIKDIIRLESLLGKDLSSWKQ